MKKYDKLLMFVVYVILVFTISCSSEPFDKAVQVLDEAIEKLESQSISWQNVLTETRDELIEEGQSTIANEVSNVLNGAITDIAVESRCDVDFLRDRVREDLLRIRASITGETLVLTPVFCNPNPSFVDYEEVQDGSVKQIEISGYNLDVATVQVFLVENGSRRDVTFALDNPSRYLLTLDLGKNAVPLSTNSDRLVFELPSSETRSINVYQSQTPSHTYGLNYANSYEVRGGGGGGGQAMSISCPTMYVATGLIGRSGELIDQIGLQCRLLNYVGTIEGEPFNTQVQGGNGGSEFRLLCPPNNMLTQVKGRSGAEVDQLQGYCSNLDGASSPPTSAVGGEGGHPFDSSCAAGYVMTGIVGRAGQEIDQINFVCTQVEVLVR